MVLALYEFMSAIMNMGVDRPAFCDRRAQAYVDRRFVGVAINLLKYMNEINISKSSIC